MLYQFSKSWVAVLLLAAIPAFIQAETKQAKCPPYDQGHEVSRCQMSCAYNAPACIKLDQCPWDVYATASFIYWQARQENMEIGLISRNDPEGLLAAGTADGPFTTSYVNNMTVTQPHFMYRPGFKIGLGMTFDWDGWDGYTEYTRFHGTTKSHVSPLPASTAVAPPPNGEYLYAFQGDPSGLGADFFETARQTWNLKMDFLDISLGRAYYSGTRLTVRPFFGARGAWIRQGMKTFYDGSTDYADPVDPNAETGYHNVVANNHSASWGVGPRAGFESNWLLGYGLRLIGNGSADILYTRYHTHTNEQIYFINAANAAAPITTNAFVSQEIDYLRTHLDLEMGFGWGMYLCERKWHLDLSATYGFQVFWDQNMFRNFENTSSQSFAPNGNLYVHGLTATARFDF